MKQRFTSFLLMTLLCVMAFAGPVGLEQAKGKAAKFFMELNGSTISASATPEYAPARSINGIKTGEETPAYYIFNAENESGYVIISGDDQTDEILGYSTNSSFDIENMPANVKAWLDGYAEQIAMMENYIPQQHANAQYSAQWTAIAPLITTKWDQSAPYNNSCPKHYEDRSVTGCTATAMAQVMKYHEWPQGTTSKIPGYTTATTKLQLPELSSTTFKWHEMKDTYRASENGDAVAELMLYCGQAIKSDYSRLSTGAYPGDVATTLPLYFGYDQNIEMKELQFYSISEWEEMIYDELKAKRPVFHAGYSMGGGHAFVCDGYDGNGMFHFNWGWGGSFDGYYKLALMNPGVGGIGSGSADGYSYGQQIIIGIQPPTGLPAKPRYLTPYYEAIQNNTTMYSAFFNMNAQSLKAYVGFGIVDENNNLNRVLIATNLITVAANSGVAITMDITRDNIKLSKGTYRIATVCKADGTSEWKRVGSRQKYFIVEIGSNGEVLSVQQAPIVEADYTWECTGNLVAQMKQEVKLTFSNKGDDLSTTIYLFASPTTTMGSAQSRTPIHIKKNETLDFILTFTPETYGTWNLWLATDSEGKNVLSSKKVNIKAAPTKQSNLTLISCVPDVNKVSAEVKIKNNSTETYYRGIVAVLYENLYNDDLLYSTEILEVKGDIASGQTKTFNIQFHGANSNNQCAIYIGYYKNHTDASYTQLGNFIHFTTGETPVENIEATHIIENDAQIYRIDGSKVNNTKQKGVYISKGKKIITK